MKIIGSNDDLHDFNSDLATFILDSCPWMSEEWEAGSIGYVFVLDESDIKEVSAICTVPHAEEDDYRSAMTIDLATFDLWESPVLHDEGTGYWNIVAILGEEYGCSLFLSSGFVESIPVLHSKLRQQLHRRSL